MFANGPGDLDSIPGGVIPKTQKMVLDASLLNTQHYKVRIKGKVEQSREGVAPSPTPWCSSYRKGSLRVTLDYGRQLYLLISSLSSYNVHLLFSSLANFALTELVLMAFFIFLLEEIQFLSRDFLLRASSKTSMRFCLLFAWNIHTAFLSSSFCFWLILVLYLVAVISLSLLFYVLFELLYRHYLQWWWILCLLLFLAYIACLWQL